MIIRIKYDPTWYPVAILNHEFDTLKAGWTRLVLINNVPTWDYSDIKVRQLIDFEDPEFTGTSLGGIAIHIKDKKSFSGFHYIESREIEEYALYKVFEIRARGQRTLPPIDEVYRKFKKPVIMWFVKRGANKAWILDKTDIVKPSVEIQIDEDEISLTKHITYGSLQVLPAKLEYDRLPRLVQRKLGNYRIEGEGYYLRWKNNAVLDGKVKIINDSIKELEGSYYIRLLD
ncbi:MAG: hypothetical protein QXW98_04230 [Candidatus Caldarchaeum sp.]